MARRINSFGVLETMADVMLMRGVPEHIRSDNGAEMTAKVVRNLLTQVGATTLFISLLGAILDLSCSPPYNRPIPCRRPSALQKLKSGRGGLCLLTLKPAEQFLQVRDLG